MPAPGRCCGPGPRRSTCWFSPGLWTPTKLPYNLGVLQARDDMIAIDIYTRPGCGYCSAAKALLTRKKAAYTEFDVSKDPALRQQMLDRAGASAASPQIFIAETHDGVCDELSALDREGKLDPLLAGEKAST